MLPEQLWNEYSPLVIFPLPGLGDSSIARQIIAKCANASIESADRNPFREYTYRQMSANRWQNPDFQNYVAIVAQYFLMRAQNTNNIQAEIDNGVRLIYNGLVSKNALEFYSNILDNNQLRECSNYLDSLNKIMHDIAINNGILPPQSMQHSGYRGQVNPQYNQQYSNQYSRNRPITGHREYNNRYNSNQNVNNQNSGVNINIDSKSSTGYNRYSDNSSNVTPSQLNRFQKLAQENIMDMEQHKLYSEPSEIMTPTGSIKGNTSEDTPENNTPKEPQEPKSVKTNPFKVSFEDRPIFTNSFKASLIDIMSEFQKENPNINQISVRNMNVVSDFPLTKELPDGFHLISLFRNYFANKIDKPKLEDILRDHEPGITTAFRYLCRLMTEEINYLFKTAWDMDNLIDDFFEDQPELIKLILLKKGIFLDLYKSAERLIKNWELAYGMREEISLVSSSALTLCESNIIITTNYNTETIKLNSEGNESICMIIDSVTSDDTLLGSNREFKGIIGTMLEKLPEILKEGTVKNVYLLTKDFNVIPIHFYLNVASATIIR